MPLKMAKLASTDPAHWEYVSEGGATIVFRYTGTKHPQFDGTVLRLRKIPLIPREYSLLHQMDDPSIDFQKEIVSLLIPETHLPELQFGQVNVDWLITLVKLRETDRPYERRMQDIVDVTKSKAVMATDLVGRKGLTVEIKVSLL